MITIFKVGDVDYTDAGLNKPVRFTNKDLESVASKTSDIRITDEHKDKGLGVLSNFVFKDGCLMADEPDGFDLNGMGLSPVFNTELVDMGDYYSISKITMDEIGLTNSPRNGILYNTVTSTSTEVNMGESALEKVIREKDELQKKIGVLENSEKQYKRMIKQHEEELNKIKESYSDTDKLVEENKILKEKADSFDVINKARKEELIQEIVGDDEKLAKEYAELSVDTLELIKKTIKVSSAQKGVTPENYPTDTDGDNPDDGGDDEDVYTDEMFEKDFAASGL